MTIVQQPKSGAFLAHPHGCAKMATSVRLPRNSGTNSHFAALPWHAQHCRRSARAQGVASSEWGVLGRQPWQACLRPSKTFPTSEVHAFNSCIRESRGCGSLSEPILLNGRYHFQLSIMGKLHYSHISRTTSTTKKTYLDYSKVKVQLMEIGPGKIEREKNKTLCNYFPLRGWLSLHLFRNYLHLVKMYYTDVVLLNIAYATEQGIQTGKVHSLTQRHHKLTRFQYTIL